MTPAPLPPSPLFAGWARTPRGRWRCLVRCRATRDEALMKLREATAGERFVDLVVLEQGKEPGQKSEKN